METGELTAHLFRKEFARIIAVICRTYGAAHLAAAEDIAGDTFLKAMETWPYRGIPPNPAAWLHTVAKRKAINYFKRQRFTGSRAPLPATADFQAAEWTDVLIGDSQLKMLFVVCHPSLSEASQVSLALRTLCGLGIDEIASALLTTQAVVNKRLYRARETLRHLQADLQMPPPAEIPRRLNAVLAILYLLFNEGYYSETRDNPLREALCAEAMRLCELLLGCRQADTPAVQALYALMCFQASRLQARSAGAGKLILYDEQDTRLWNQALISRGAQSLHQASRGDSLSSYHLEAMIAYWHTVRADDGRKWPCILELFDRLMTMAPTPVAALNRIYAFSRVHGCQAALRELGKFSWKESAYYHALAGALYRQLDPPRARAHFRRAQALAAGSADKAILERHLQRLDRPEGKRSRGS